MRRKITTLLFFLAFSFVPFNVTAQQESGDLLLSQSEAWSLLKRLPSQFTNQNVLRFTDLTGEEQAVIFTLRGAVNQEFLQFLPWFIGTESIEVAIKIAGIVQKISEATTKELIGELEKLTIKEANKRGMEWLLGHEVKTASGELTDKKTGATFQYLMVFQKLGDKKGELVVQFYSSNSFDPGSPWGDLSTGRPFFSDRSLVNGQVRPFVVTIETQVEEIALGWMVDQNEKRMTVNIEFPEEVPRLELSAELPYPLEKQKRKVIDILAMIEKIGGTVQIISNNAGQKIIDFANAGRNLVEQVSSFIAQFGGAVASEGFIVETDSGRYIVERESTVEEANSSEELPELVIAPVENLSRSSFSQEEVVQESSQQKSVENDSQEEKSVEDVVVKEALVEDTAAEEVLVEVRDEKKAEKQFTGCVSGQINVNTATFVDLQELTGVGSTLAQRIIDEREGELFSSLDELARVSGIGNISVQNIKAQGLACAADVQDASFQPFQKQVFTGGGGSSSHGEDASLSSEEEAGEEEDTAACEPASIDVNSASFEDLLKISHITDTRAEDLVSKRPFSSIDDLIRITGIAAVRLGDIKEQGCAYVSVESSNQENEPEEQEDEIEEEQEVEEENPTDETPPQISFFSAENQNDGTFVLSWNAYDPVDEAPASGVSKTFLQYETAPAQEGAFLSFWEGEGFQEWNAGVGGILSFDVSAETATISTQDGVRYLFSLYAEDNAGNASATETLELSADLPKTVVINEITWMGTNVSTADEWIELYNPGSTPVDLSGWKLEAEDGTPSINLQGTISAGGFFLLERTNNETVSDITADLVYTGALEDAGENLRLYNSEGALTDWVNASSGWFAGKKEGRISMERIDAEKSGSDPANWHSNIIVVRNGEDADGNPINGTPRSRNSVSYETTPIVSSKIPFDEFDIIELPLIGSPYEVSQFGITIPESKTLTVEPGVSLIFSQLPGSFFDIYGTLLAEGSEDAIITFTSEASWKGIRVFPESTGTILEHVYIEGAAHDTVGTWKAAITVEQASITLKDSLIEESLSGGKIYLKDSGSLIENVHIEGANAGLSTPGIVVNGGSPQILNSTFINNSRGILIWGSGGIPEIIGNTFEQNH
ncbi:MAG: helix-hairpin-helix domain-containing protein, partial [bacterium]|nr:helix-hairpin-helix domain-containing protein [bacterium]